MEDSDNRATKSYDPLKINHRESNKVDIVIVTVGGNQQSVATQNVCTNSVATFSSMLEKPVS